MIPRTWGMQAAQEQQQKAAWWFPGAAAGARGDAFPGKKPPVMQGGWVPEVDCPLLHLGLSSSTCIWFVPRVDLMWSFHHNMKGQTGLHLQCEGMKSYKGFCQNQNEESVFKVLPWLEMVLLEHGW